MIRYEVDTRALLEDLRRIGNSPRTDAAQAAFTAAARSLAAAARRAIPVGRHPEREYKGVKWSPGLRKRSVKVGRSSRTNLNLYKGPWSSVFMAVRRGADRAPHAHLAEFGTGVRQSKSGKLLKFENYGRWNFVRRVAPQQGDMAFTKAVRQNAGAALESARRAFARVIEKSA